MKTLADITEVHVSYGADYTRTFTSLHFGPVSFICTAFDGIVKYDEAIARALWEMNMDFHRAEMLDAERDAAVNA